MLASVISRFNEKRAGELEGEAADSGFTLIELMVVLLIMAILLAIAIPTFLGVKGGAQDRAAQSNLNTALTNAKAVYGNNQSYGTSSLAVSSLSSSEASLSFDAVGGTSTGQNVIEVATEVNGNSIMLINKSSAGDCWGILTNETTASLGQGASTWPKSTAAGTYYTSWKPTVLGPCTTATGYSATWQINSFPSAA